ncbi:hypothetical protein I8748_32160 [Nostoc sp. CENA67]|uniref:Uncharacterized protein n=1 Tax=Amazonocrinis nigriterrae CENA67 TaxID=2794033 RepID=A0A8J7I275_9NOST|nr:hypothetical protein [Amazonocrinis nigriterrae]MBH8566754.1 hypothetical protein [Amazonocrinis nigriterrae CENA67]
MSAFNPLPSSRQLTPQEWQSIAIDSLNSNAQFVIVGSVVGGIIAASVTAFPPTFFVIAGCGIYEGFRRIKEVGRNHKAITTYNCVAHVLSGDDLRDYCYQVGYQEAVRQVRWAIQHEYVVSDDALDLAESPGKFMLSAAAPAPLPAGQNYSAPTVITPVPAPTVTAPLPVQNYSAPAVITAPPPVIEYPTPTIQTQISNYAPPVSAEINLIEAMVGREIRNQLFVGIQGAGKGVFVSNALAGIRKYHPRRKIFVIDPKGKDEELGYWENHADYLHRAKILEMQPHEVVAWIQECFEEYAKIPGECLLFLDEGIAVSSSFKAQRGAISWLKNKVSHFVSLGDGDGKNFWMAIQNGDAVDLGISGGMRSQLNPYVIINPKQMAAYESVINLELLPRDKKPSSEEITAIASRSPVGRALYHGALNEWMPMQKLENFSGFDRDTRTFIKGSNTATIAPPTGQVAALFKKLEATQETVLARFIAYELGILGEKHEQMKQRIAEAINQHGRKDLQRKFVDI